MTHTGDVYLKRLKGHQRDSAGARNYLQDQGQMRDKIKVLIVDDSSVVRQTLKDILSSDPGLRSWQQRPTLL